MTRFRNLDICVLEALQYFADLQKNVAEGKIEPEEGIPSLHPDPGKPVMVVGSGNAILTGKCVYRHTPAVFANQDNYWHEFERFKSVLNFNEIVIISASGRKDGQETAKKLKQHEKETGETLPPRRLLTNNPDAPAAAYVDPKNVVVFPELDDEPYTYNVSTYMSMLLGNSGEAAEDIARYLEEEVEVPRDFGRYSAYYFLVPAEYEDIGEMFNIKFREIFGCHLGGRASTSAHARHGLFVHPSEEELVVGLGVQNRLHGYSRLNVDLPDLGPARLMALGYYLIGQIQRRKEPWFKLNSDDYHDRVRTLAGWKV